MNVGVADGVLVCEAVTVAVLVGVLVGVFVGDGVKDAVGVGVMQPIGNIASPIEDAVTESGELLLRVE